MKSRLFIAALAVCFATMTATASAADLQVTSPLHGSMVSQTPFNITYTLDGTPVDFFHANSNSYIVQCWVDGVLLGTINSNECLSGNSHPSAALNGSHTFSVLVRQADGAELGSASSTFTVADNSPPTLDISSPTANATITQTPFAVVYVSDDYAGVLTRNLMECRVDDEEWENCGQFSTLGLGWHNTYFPPSITNGPHQLSVRATDPAQNQTLKTVEVVVDDTVAPTIAFSDFVPADGAVVTASPPTFNFSIDGSPYSNTLKALYDTECRLDSGAWQNCESGWYFPRAGNGLHTVEVRSADLVGNQTDPAVARGFAISDHSAPELILNSPVEGETTTDPWIRVSPALMPHTDLFYRLDDGPWTAGTMLGFDVPVSVNGSHALDVKIADWAGNESSVQRRNVIVAAPGISVPAAPESPVLPPERSRLAAFSAKRKRVGRAISVTASAMVVSASGASVAVCAGDGSLEVMRGRKLLKRVRASVRTTRGRCVISAGARLTSRQSAGALKLRLTFAGNAGTESSSAAKRVR